MKFLLNIGYALVSNLIYIMYLDLFFKNKKDLKGNRIIFLIIMTVVSLFINKHLIISYGDIILFIISLIYAYLFYIGDHYNKLTKIIFVYINMILIDGLCLFLLNRQTLHYVFNTYDGLLGYLIRFTSKDIWLIEYFYLKQYLKKEFQLNKHIWLFVMLTLGGIIILDIYTFNNYLMNQISISFVICLYMVSCMVIVLIYILCLEMTNYYQGLMNQKIHEQALQYEETLIEITNQKTKEYNKIVHDYKKLIDDVSQNHQVDHLSANIPMEVFHTNNIALNYVFNQYMEIMKKQNIDFYGTYSNRIYPGVSSNDLTMILKIFLDHALMLNKNVENKAIHYKIESQEYCTIIKIKCFVQKDFFDFKFKRKEYIVEEICEKYNGRKISKIEDNYYIFGCYLENSEDLL